MKKFLIILDGPMGSGKTTLAKLLQERKNNVARIGLDQIKWFVSGFKRTKLQNEITRTIVKVMVREYLKHNINVVIEEAMREGQIIEYKKIAKEYNAKFLYYKLIASKEVLLNRINSRTQVLGRPKVSFSRILKNYIEYTKSEKQKGVYGKTFNTEILDPKVIVKEVLSDIK